MTNDTPSTPQSIGEGITSPVDPTDSESLSEIAQVFNATSPMFIHAIGLGFGRMDPSTGDSELVGLITLSGQVANPMADLDITGLKGVGGIEGIEIDVDGSQYLTVNMPGVMTLDALRGLRAKMDRVIAEVDAYVARMAGEGPGEGQ